MVLNENECSNALYNANHRELHVSTLMGFWSYYMKESVLLGTKPLAIVDSIYQSIWDLSVVFSVRPSGEYHIAHRRHNSRLFYLVE